MNFGVEVSSDIAEFIDRQVEQGHYASRSEVLTAALLVWRDRLLEPAYTEAFASIDPLWDAATGDGLEN